MRERVRVLRQKSLDVVPTLAIERAELVTDAYEKYYGSVSVPVMRALAFKEICERRTIFIDDGELIVGEKGPVPKAAPTCPELCCHTLEDFDVINNREKVFFKVDERAKKIQEEKIIPYWKDKSIRSMIFNEMTPEWKDCYDAGIFTEFLEQRSPGHVVGDDKIYRKGFLDFKKDIEDQTAKLDWVNDHKAYDKNEELKAMAICCDAIIALGKRHAEKAFEMAKTETNEPRKYELEKIAEVCDHVPANAPRNYWEALQMYWFVHLGVTTELNTWDAYNPGRLDQHLYPFYKKDFENGTLTYEDAEELLQLFWIKFNNQPSPPKVGVTMNESASYTDFANIPSGGLTVDGSDAVNDMTYMVLDVIDELRILQPSSNVQVSKKNPDKFVKRACRIIRKGWGQPSVFNADAVVEEMVRQGKSIEDARCGGTSGCVEIVCFGKESMILTGYFNLPKIFEITLNNGVDPRTGKKIGIETGNPATFASYEELVEAYKKQVHHFMEIKIAGNNVNELLYAKYMSAPFLSLMVDDCIKNNKDYYCGGARYNTSYIMGVGIATLTDSLAGIKYNVFDSKNVTMSDLLDALKNNFEGRERIRQMLVNKTPKYGNDDEYADTILKEAFNIYLNEVAVRKNPRGGNYFIFLLPTTCHVYFGSVTGATPDGRKAWTPQSEGISPVQGTDKLGPTAVIKSASKIDHLKTGGTLLNLKFTPSILEGEEGIDNLTHLIRSYFKMDGHHVQFNVVSANTLREAKKKPEQYKDLIVRVAGYSDYFNDLGEALQDEIIARTEQTCF